MFAYDFDGDGDNDVATTLAAHNYGVAVFENKHGIATVRPVPSSSGQSVSVRIVSTDFPVTVFHLTNVTPAPPVANVLPLGANESHQRSPKRLSKRSSH